MITAIRTPDEIIGLLDEMVRLDASDLFIFPDEPPAFRVRGQIERSDQSPLSAEEIRAIADIAFGDTALARIGKEMAAIRGVCFIETDNAAGKIRFLVVAGRSCGAITITIRLLPSQLFSADTLGIPAAVLEVCAARRGLIIFSGQVGSGVITSAASCVDHINATRKVQICAISDPIEYLFEPRQSIIQHKEVGIDVPDVVSGISAAMQQDIDVLFLSELKCTEDLEAALRVAQFALVVAVVHAASPEAAIERMVLAFPPDMQGVSRAAIANSLICVTNQILLPRADSKGRVAAYGVFTPDRSTCLQVAETPNLSATGFSRGEGPLPRGYAPIAQHIEQLRATGIISNETAKTAFAEC